jgi:hypothetical protein
LEPSPGISFDLVRIGDSFSRLAFKIEEVPGLFDLTVEFLVPILGAENFRECCSFRLVYSAVLMRKLS